MFDMDKKPWYEKPPIGDSPCHDRPPFGDKPPCKPYTPFEKAEETIREMRATIDRLLKFERWLKDTHDILMKEITRDNVIFKETYAEQYRLFLEQVKTEVNQFESDVVNKWKLFETTVLADYNNLSADTAKQIEENYNAFVAKFNEVKAYMKTNLNATLENLLYEMKEAGALTGVIDSEVIGNVKAYGAVGDGVTDDTQAFVNCLAEHNNIYVPEGTYVINSTITIDSYKRITGEGAKSIIKYTGTNYLFNVTTPYNAKAEINNLAFNGNGDNKFLKCAKGSWGASVSLDGVNVTNFTTALHFISVFNATVKNARIYGANIIESVSGDPETTFSNVNTFNNVYFDGNKGDVLFTLSNVRTLTFNNCALENATKIFSCTNKSHKVRVIGCWVEGAQYLFDVDDTSEDIHESGNIYVGIKSMKYNASTEVNDVLRNTNVYVYGASSTDKPIQTALMRNERINGASIYDKDNEAWGDLYGFYTNKAFYHAPFNTKIVNVTGVTGATLTFKDAVGAWCNTPILHEITAVVAGNDGSKKMARYEILQNDYSSFVELFDPIVRTTGWNGSVISDENIDISCTSGIFTVTHNENQTVSRITIIDKYTVLGANINNTFNV